MKKMFLILALLVMPMTANAYTCGDLHEWWPDYKGFYGSAGGNKTYAGFYANYVNGVYEGFLHSCGYLELFDEDSMTRKVLCRNSYSSYKQVHHIVGNWLEKNPKQWGDPAASCIHTALQLD